MTVNSGHASIVLEAAAVLHGNFLLRGWTLTSVSFYTLGQPFYVAAVAWRGLTPGVMRELSAVIYALTVLGAVWLAARRAPLSPCRPILPIIPGRKLPRKTH